MGVGLVASVYRAGKALVEAAPALTVQSWQALTTAGAESYHPAWAPVLLGELVFNLAFGVGALLLIWLMARRRSSLPRLYIAWWAVVMAFNLVEAAVFQLVPPLQEHWTGKETGELIKMSLAAVIWVSYMLRSERVRRTFVRRLRAELPPDPQSPAITPA